MKKKGLIIIGSVALAIVVAVLLLNAFKNKADDFKFETAKAENGNLSITVTATGTIEAIKTVLVGTQVSGVIQKLYVDFNSRVKKGQILAQLDKTPLLATLEQSKAAVDQAKANLDLQKANFDRIQALFSKKLVAQSDFDQANYNYENALAALNNAQSQYNRNKINLDYASIYSPIDGVVLNRAVDEGQTVAASFNTPTLFTIANDLTQMQVEASVDEADIGQVKNDEMVDFNVDAYPDITFKGKVTEVRLQPVVTSNVVTYTVIVSAPNPDKKLMPGMTANITIYIAQKNNVLVVPSKALLFKPDFAMLRTYSESLPEGERPKFPNSGNPGHKGNPGHNWQNGNSTGFTENKADTTRIWIKNGLEVHPKKVKTGLDDGTNIEVVSGLNKGDEVVLSMTQVKGTSKKNQGMARSPFMPQRPNRNNNRTNTNR